MMIKYGKINTYEVVCDMAIDIGIKIKTMRLTKGISQNALSKKAGVAQSTLSYIESGKKHPHFDTLSVICKGLDTTVLELLSFNEQQHIEKSHLDPKDCETQRPTTSSNLSYKDHDYERSLYQKYNQENA